MVLFLADNFLWLFNWGSGKATQSDIRYINAEEKNVLKLIEAHSDAETLVIGGDELIPYLTSVYTKAYPWYSHPFTTSYSKKKLAAYLSFIRTGTIEPAWHGRKIIFIFSTKLPGEFERAGQPGFPYKVLYESSNYRLFEATP